MSKLELALRDCIWKLVYQEAIKKKRNGRRHPLIYTWHNMITRCYNPNSYSFDNYGARDISVCERWFDFEKFIEDMGEPMFPSYTLDRINNEGNYEPGNCRWASRSTQAKNRRIMPGQWTRCPRK